MRHHGDSDAQVRAMDSAEGDVGVPPAKASGTCQRGGQPIIEQQGTAQTACVVGDGMAVPQTPPSLPFLRHTHLGAESADTLSGREGLMGSKDLKRIHISLHACHPLPRHLSLSALSSLHSTPCPTFFFTTSQRRRGRQEPELPVLGAPHQAQRARRRALSTWILLQHLHAGRVMAQV